ncbi:hypothetical protein B0H21DRAFT_93648 [Amylocystis lapponica]|nr:hypothetical protein B0H21DRAFT_93648 [Amylocystis lapponica]
MSPTFESPPGSPPFPDDHDPGDETSTLARAFSTHLHITDDLGDDHRPPSDRTPSTDTRFPDIPIELAFHIFKLGLADRELAHTLAQVCSWTHRLAMPRLYTTLSPISQPEQLTKFPDHLVPVVQNVWFETSWAHERGARYWAEALVGVCWVYFVRGHVAVSARMMLDLCAVPQTFIDYLARTRPHACSQLTLFGPELHMLPGDPIPLLRGVTHLRVLEPKNGVCLYFLGLRMPALGYLAVPLLSLGEQDCRMLLEFVMMLMDQAHFEMAVVVVPAFQGPGELQTTARVAMARSEKLFIMPGRYDMEVVRKEWDAALYGIWRGRHLAEGHSAAQGGRG